MSLIQIRRITHIDHFVTKVAFLSNPVHKTQGFGLYLTSLHRRYRGFAMNEGTEEDKSTSVHFKIQVRLIENRRA
jgi:hypothetical protein